MAGEPQAVNSGAEVAAQQQTECNPVWDVDELWIFPVNIDSEAGNGKQADYCDPVRITE